MSKGDKVTVALRLGESFTSDEVEVKQNGGQVEVERTREHVIVSLLNRAGSPIVKHTYDKTYVARVSEWRKDL